MSKDSELVDVEIHATGSVVMFAALSRRSLAWVEKNVALESWQWFGPAAFAVEHHYAEELVAAMRADGLKVV